MSDGIPPSSWYGTLLKGIFNFSPATTKLEAAAWLLYVIPTLTIFLYKMRRRTPAALRPSGAAPAGVLRKEMIMTRSPRAGGLALPVRALLCTSTWPSRCRCWRPAPTTLPPSSRAPAPPPNPRALTVQATDTACTLSAPTAPSGNLTFSVTNGGTQGDRVLPAGEDGLRIIGEIENIGPGMSRDLVLRAGPGDYFTACKPGMVGDGIRAPFAVSDSGEDRRRAATTRSWSSRPTGATRPTSKDQTEQLVAKTAKFVDRVQGRQGRRGPRPVRAGPGALGADRDRRRVLRRPGPEDGHPRGRPGAGPEVDRLAPDREGPVAGPGQGLRAAQHGPSAPSTPTT